MTKRSGDTNQSWLCRFALIGLLGLMPLSQTSADAPEKDEIIEFLGTETKPARSLLPDDVSVQPDFLPGTGSAVGTVQLREGDPLVIHQGESVAYPLKRESPVFTGDTIITEENARVNLIMNDKSVLAIAPYSKLTIDETIYSPESNTRSSTLHLLFGRIRSIVSKIEGKPNYWVQTPTSVAGVRGSDFGVAATDQHSALVTTEETEVELDGAVITPCMVAGGGQRADVASGSSDHTIRLWNSATGEQVAELDGHSGPVTSVAFSPNGEILASGSTDRTVRLWNVNTGESLHVLEGYGGPITSVAFSPDGTTVVAASTDNSIRIWSANSGRQLGLLTGHSGPVSAVVFSPDGTRIASASADNTIRIWDVSSGQQTALLRGHSGSVSTVAFSPDGKTLASGSTDHTIRLWDPDSGQQIGLMENGPVAVYSVAFSPDGNTLIAGSADNVVRMWDVRERGQPRWLEADSDHAYSVAVSPDNALVASGSEDHSIHLWDLRSGQAAATELEGHEQPVLSVAFRPGLVDQVAGAYAVPCETAAGLVNSIGPDLAGAAVLGMPPEFD